VNIIARCIKRCREKWGIALLLIDKQKTLFEIGMKIAEDPAYITYWRRLR